MSEWARIMENERLVRAVRDLEDTVRQQGRGGSSATLPEWQRPGYVAQPSTPLSHGAVLVGGALLIYCATGAAEWGFGLFGSAIRPGRWWLWLGLVWLFLNGYPSRVLPRAVRSGWATAAGCAVMLGSALLAHRAFGLSAPVDPGRGLLVTGPLQSRYVSDPSAGRVLLLTARVKNASAGPVRRLILGVHRAGSGGGRALATIPVTAGYVLAPGQIVETSSFNALGGELATLAPELVEHPDRFVVRVEQATLERADRAEGEAGEIPATAPGR
jgi:hypothetical protein